MLGKVAMALSARRRIAIDIRWTTIFKLLAAAALVWIWLTLAQLVLVLVVAVLLAVTLTPVVDWFERRGWARSTAAGLIFAALLVGLRLSRGPGSRPGVMPARTSPDHPRPARSAARLDATRAGMKSGGSSHGPWMSGAPPSRRSSPC
jgi:hypothetical protein